MKDNKSFMLSVRLSEAEYRALVIAAMYDQPEEELNISRYVRKVLRSQTTIETANHQFKIASV